MAVKTWAELNKQTKAIPTSTKQGTWGFVNAQNAPKPVLNKFGVDVSKNVFNPLNPNSQFVDPKGTSQSAFPQVNPIKEALKPSNLLAAAKSILPGTSQTVSKIKQDPLNLQSIPALKEQIKNVKPSVAPAIFQLDFAKNMWNAIKEPIKQEAENIKNVFKDKGRDSIASQTSNTAKVFTGGANIVFSPITALFEGAKTIPVLGSVADVVALPFQAMGEGGTGLANGIINKLPISSKAKEQLKPGIEEIFALAGQLALGKTGWDSKTFAKLKDKFGTQDANTIIAKATELANQKKAGEFPQANPIPAEVQPKIATTTTLEAPKLTKKAIETTKPVETKVKSELAQLREYAQSKEKTPARQKGIAMEFAGIERGLNQKPTTIEFNKAKDYLNSNYKGKQVNYGVTKGEVIGTSFGKIGLKLEDGTIKYVPKDKITQPKIMRSDVLNHIKEQAQIKFDSKKQFYSDFKPTTTSDAITFIKTKGIDPNSVSIVDNNKSIVENSAGNKAILTELPLSSFDNPKFTTLNQTDYKPGRKIVDPIEATIKDGKLIITDGANRFTQAVANKDATIPVILDNFKGKVPTRAELASITNKIELKAKETIKTSKKATKSPKVESKVKETKTTETKVSKVASDISKNLAEKGWAALSEEQLAKYDPITKKATIEKVSKFMDNIEKAKEVIRTGEAPGDFKLADKQVLFNAMEEYATKHNDIQGLLDLANSPIATELSVAAQTLGASGFNKNPESIVAKIKEINQIRRETAAKKLKVDNIDTVIKKEAAKIKPKPATKMDWETFVKEIKC